MLERLRLWPETGFSLAERIILAEWVWMHEPFPPEGGGNGRIRDRLDYWLAKVDEMCALPFGLNLAQSMKMKTIKVDFDGSFEPYTLRLPDEPSLSNPSVRVFSCSGTVLQ